LGKFGKPEGAQAEAYIAQSTSEYRPVVSRLVAISSNQMIAMYAPSLVQRVITITPTTISTTPIVSMKGD